MANVSLHSPQAEEPSARAAQVTPSPHRALSLASTPQVTPSPHRTLSLASTPPAIDESPLRLLFVPVVSQVESTKRPLPRSGYVSVYDKPKRLSLIRKIDRGIYWPKKGTDPQLLYDWVCALASDSAGPPLLNGFCDTGRPLRTDP